MTNLDIRILLAENKIHQCEVAQVLNVSKAYISQILTKPLRQDQHEKIINAIQQILDRRDSLND